MSAVDQVDGLAVGTWLCPHASIAQYLLLLR